MSSSEIKKVKANSIINNHVMFSLGAGLVPIPILDIAAVTAVQLDLLRQLSNLYDIDFKENIGKNLISALSSSTLARVGASFIKVIPGIGSLIGGVSMSIMAGASTYAIGQVFARHFASGGNFEDVVMDKAKKMYEEEFEKGKEVAGKMNKNKKAGKPKAGINEQVFDQIEKLATLKEKGAITDKEFQTMKDKLLKDLL